ncbi:MAG: ATP-binding protein [Pseudobdellovibrionaceae bacterium]
MALPPSLTKSTGFLKGGVLYSALRLVLACGMGVFISQLKLDTWESGLYDMRVRWLPSRSPSGHIEIITTTSKTVEYLKGLPTAKDQLEILKNLEREEPLAVLYTQNLEELQGTSEEKKAFAEEAQKINNLYMISQDLEMKGEEGKLKLSEPLSAIELFAGPRTNDGDVLAQDKVTRRMMVTYQDRQMVHPFIAGLINPAIREKKNIRGLFSFFDSEQVYINYLKANSYPQTSFEDVMSGKFTPGQFKNKIVLLGNDHGGALRDYVKTPFSSNAKAMTLVELNANMIDTLIQNSAPVQASPWLNILVTILTSILTVHVLFTTKPIRSLLILAFTGLALVILGTLGYWPGGYWIKMAHPFLAIFLCYYFFIPYRLIIENRRSWEYYEKNKLLSQVEELKGNFISMMSHDLKTPIARIQGMTDVILKDPQPLSTQQREALDTIRQSDEDLLKFINAILNYGKIESQGIELHMQSRDVNALLKEVIRKHEFLAKVKRIPIEFECEPLFPIQVDPDLIKQVFSNLLENAIKYSPEAAQVRVQSEEKDGKVIVRVADCGPGIPQDEVNNIFMKFFRSKNAKSSPIKGSGLGLYLAKYFTELHQGRIFVESTYGKGCTFTVELPLEQGRSHA